MLAAGGTGGHLFPAYALCEELKRRGLNVHIVTDERIDDFGGETPANEMHVVPSATLKSRNPLALIRTVFTLGIGTIKALMLLRRIKPGFVLGFGGYPTFPPVLAASLLGIKTGLHDQNAVMGRANRMLASKVDVIATSFERVKYLPESSKAKTHFTGNPVRDAVIAVADTPYQAPLFNETFKLLIFGGSQGARFFSEFFPAALAKLDDDLRKRLLVVQQCRREDLKATEAIYAQAGIANECALFFADLPKRISEAHLVISRSGASTVTELAVCGRPAIMVPLPHALDNDQLHNARRLVDVNGGWIMEQNQITEEKFLDQFKALAAMPSDLQNAANAAKSIGQPRATAKLADMIMSFVDG